MIRKVLRFAKDKAPEPSFDRGFKTLTRRSPGARSRGPFGAEELRLVYEALRSQDLFYQGGRMVTSFEREFAEAYGVPYAIASTSGTAAIHVALGALDLNPG